MSIGPPYVLLGEVSVQVLCPFFNWMVCLPGVESYEFYIYFGDHTLVRYIIGKYIFSYSLFPFHFADVFFSHQKFFILMYSHFFIFSFIFLALGDISAKILLHGISNILLAMFSSRTFMASQLIFKYFIHVEFILLYDEFSSFQRKNALIKESFL